MSLTTDPHDPRLTRGIDETPRPQAEVYIVLSEEELAKGFVRPVRTVYKHVGRPGPKYPLRDLTDDERTRFGADYIKFEEYPESARPAKGRFWSQADFAAMKGCGIQTSMGITLAETYARDPSFYGATYCVPCGKHRPVGADGEFVWLDGSRVGT